MNIQLVSTKAVQISLDYFDLEEEDSSEFDEEDFTFDFNPMIAEEDGDTNTFLVVFIGEMKNNIEKYKSKVVYLTQFETDESISCEFLKDNFALINAPAIGYPYFRAFYSNLLLNSGYKPFVLPTINFVKLREDKLKEINQ